MCVVLRSHSERIEKTTNIFNLKPVCRVAYHVNLKLFNSLMSMFVMFNVTANLQPLRAVHVPCWSYTFQECLSAGVFGERTCPIRIHGWIVAAPPLRKRSRPAIPPLTTSSTSQARYPHKSLPCPASRCRAPVALLKFSERFFNLQSRLGRACYQDEMHGNVGTQD